MPKFSIADVFDPRDIQGETLFVVWADNVSPETPNGPGRYELWAKPATLIAVSDTIRALTRYAHGEHCAAVRIDSAIEDA